MGNKVTGAPRLAGKRQEKRIAVSEETLRALTEEQLGGEPFDVLIRRMLVTAAPKKLDQMSERQQAWVLNEPESSIKTT